MKELKCGLCSKIYFDHKKLSINNAIILSFSTFISVLDKICAHCRDVLLGTLIKF